MTGINDISQRHAATQQILRWFSYDHLPASPGRDRAQDCHAFAHTMVRFLPDDPELTAGLRKLLEAKDCFVRAAIAASMVDRES